LINGFNSMTDELRRNQIELAELERENAWKEMAKQVAHEIKNPLTPMKLAMQQLIISYRDKNKNFDSIFEKVSSTILKQIESLSSIASEFSRFARMPNYKLEIIDLIPVIKDTINLFGEDKIKITFETEVRKALLETDDSQLRRMFINLIRNSIQADASLINISLQEKNNFYKIFISDNGKGISFELKDKVFEANFTTKEKGMGLGLKLTKRFLEGINGSIKLADSSNNGTVFEINIPKMNV
jgi:two-component system, NtrC family, nitrogen regulation sensor histidine kinase NtrY